MLGAEQPPTFHVANYGNHGQAIGQQINIGRQERTFRGRDVVGVRAAAARFPDSTVTMTCLLGDGEGFSFAHELTELLGDAGWTVEGVNQAIFMMLTSPQLGPRKSPRFESGQTRPGPCAAPRLCLRKAGPWLPPKPLAPPQ